MRIELPRMGHEATVCPDGTTALAALDRNTYDCILVDLDMPGCNGIDVIARAKQLSPETEAIVLTGKSSLETAVAALRHGAFDYLTKPCKLVDLESLLRPRGRKTRADQQISGDEAAAGTPRGLARPDRRIAGDGAGSPVDRQGSHDRFDRADPRRNGHRQGACRPGGARPEPAGRMPLVPINCGALPENLIESELFGHRKGAFTGADEHRIGLLQVANGGSLFLDEIGELPKTMQAKLLRFLESGEVRRVGDNESFICDVRVICATNRDLAEMVADGEFREDLWFRINTFEIPLPPLRERIEDIPLLARRLAAPLRRAARQRRRTVSARTLEMLMGHTWPGNVRELANVIEHALILCDSLPIRPEHLPHRFSSPHASTAQFIRPRRSTSAIARCRRSARRSDRHHGNKPKAAEELGISLKTLYNKLNQAESLGKTG